MSPWLLCDLARLALTSLLYFKAFTVVTVFNSMTFALKVTPFSVKSLSEASVAVDRYKVSGALPGSVSGAALGTACLLPVF